jgi:DEAD/DEAH box helicase domain-containing protein
MTVRDFQVIATTATLRDPVGHLRELTGMEFVEIGEEHNGAPSYGVSVLHIDGPECGAPAERAATETVCKILESKAPGTGLIAFLDSRQGVERMVRNVGSKTFLPYRQGYILEDRRAIERALRDACVDGVGATSALEAGIHLPQFVYGLTVNVPPSRKSLRQRSGRIGRTRPGVFIVQAPRSAFAKLGTTLADSFLGPVEPSPLYLDNRYIQLQQACCYLREAELDDGEPVLDADLQWPAEFGRFLGYAQAGAQRPRDLEETARLGFDNPHRTFGLRAMPSVTYILKNVRSGDSVGTIDQQKALREAAPGMAYVHCGRAYRVVDWRSSAYENAIMLTPVRDAPRTQAILRCQVGVSCEPDAVIQDNYLASDSGALFEAQLRVVESAEGYRIGSTALLYRDLRQNDRRLTRKQREYLTTGVAIQIDEPWFAGSSDNQIATRRAVAAAFKAVMAHEYGVAPADVQAAHTTIAMHSPAGARKIENAIVVFDTVAGGLRLTAPLFADFADILRRLERGAALAGAEALISQTELARLQAWFGQLQRRVPSGTPAVVGHDRLLIFAPGSRVLITIRGQSLERELGEPQLLVAGDEEKLMYRYDAGGGAQGWVADDHVTPSGNNWRRATWDPITNAIELLETSA